MVDERTNWISKRAYDLWERAGQPQARMRNIGCRRPRSVTSWNEREHRMTAPRSWRAIE
jgi:hypothetical protein